MIKYKEHIKYIKIIQNQIQRRLELRNILDEDFIMNNVPDYYPVLEMYLNGICELNYDKIGTKLDMITGLFYDRSPRSIYLHIKLTKEKLNG